MTVKPTTTTDTYPTVTHDDIATRAYAIFLARGGVAGDGQHEADWHEAERQLHDDIERRHRNGSVPPV